MGCHVLFQGDLPDPGIKPRSLMSPALSGRFFTTSATLKWVNIMCKLESTEWGWERSNQACHIHIFSRFLCRASDMRQSKKLTLIGLALSAGKDSACNAGDLGSIPGLGRSQRRKATHSSFLAWRIVHGITKSWTQLSDFHFTSLEHY